MSKVRAQVDAFVGVNGVPVRLHSGDEHDADDPIVRACPELFTQPTEEPKRPVLSRPKSKGADD